MYCRQGKAYELIGSLEQSNTCMSNALGDLRDYVE